MTTGTPGLIVPAFSAAIAASVVAELGLVVEVDRGDRRDQRRDDVGRVEAAAESHLHDGEVGAAWRNRRTQQPSSPRRTSAQRSGARRLQARDGVPTWPSAASSATRETGWPSPRTALRGGPDGARCSGPDQAARRQRVGHHRADRSFAVGAGDVQDGTRAFGMAERIRSWRAIVSRPSLMPNCSRWASQARLSMGGIRARLRPARRTWPPGRRPPAAATRAHRRA